METEPTDEPMPDEPMPGEDAEIAVIEDAVPVPITGARPILRDDEIRRLWRLAGALASSGMFPDATQAGQAFAKIVMGRDLGLSPTQAMTGIHIVEGKPQMHYSTLGGFVRAREGYDFRKKVRTDERCVLEWTRDDWATSGEWSFTIEQAKKRGLVKSRGNWEKMPEVMLFARTLSQGVREDMPEVLGGVPVYAEGEIEPETRRIGGTGEPEGIELGPKVEAVLIRAKALGHEGIADRATAEMALGDQPPQVVDQWVANAHRELDVIDPAKQGDACTCEYRGGRHIRSDGCPLHDERPDPEPVEAPEDEPETVDPDEVEQPKETP
jgi:hypothetical protein